MNYQALSIEIKQFMFYWKLPSFALLPAEDDDVCTVLPGKRTSESPIYLRYSFKKISDTSSLSI